MLSAALPTFSPLYQQIKTALIDNLQAGAWSPGDSLPSEGDLATRFQVSQGTVRKAIDEMVSEKLLVRRQGKGTFVATHDDPQFSFRFLRLAGDDEQIRQSLSEPLSCQEITAPAPVAAAMQIGKREKVIFIERLLRFGKEVLPVVFDEIYLLASSFPALKLSVLQENSGSLYGFLENEYGVRMIRAEERIRAIAATAKTAALLGVNEGVPLLQVERSTYTYGDKIVEWRRGMYSTAQHFYLNALS